jgi:hypothetical protein
VGVVLLRDPCIGMIELFSDHQQWHPLHGEPPGGGVAQHVEAGRSVYGKFGWRNRAQGNSTCRHGLSEENVALNRIIRPTEVCEQPVIGIVSVQGLGEQGYRLPRSPIRKYLRDQG